MQRGVVNPEGVSWLTSSQASQDKRELVRATRRLVKKSQANPSKRFSRCLAVPEDEQAVIQYRREAQEDEWRQLLARGKRSRSASSATSAVESYATSGTRLSAVTAGLHSEDTAWRAEDNRCAAYGKMCLAFAPGDVLPRQPVIPLEPASVILPDCLGDAELEALAPRSGLGKLERLMQMGTRPR